MGIDDLNGLHLLVQQLGRGALVTEEAELHIFGGERRAIVEGQALTELELIDQSIRALCPRLRQAGRHIIPGERFEQRVMEGIQKHKGRCDPRRLGRIEIGRSDRSVKGDDELSLRLALRSGVCATNHDDYTYNEPHESVVQHTPTSSCPPVCTLLRVMT